MKENYIWKSSQRLRCDHISKGKNVFSPNFVWVSIDTAHTRHNDKCIYSIQHRMGIKVFRIVDRFKLQQSQINYFSYILKYLHT